MTITLKLIFWCLASWTLTISGALGYIWWNSGKFWLAFAIYIVGLAFMATYGELERDNR